VLLVLLASTRDEISPSKTTARCAIDMISGLGTSSSTSVTRCAAVEAKAGFNLAVEQRAIPLLRLTREAQSMFCRPRLIVEGKPRKLLVALAKKPRRMSTLHMCNVSCIDPACTLHDSVRRLVPKHVV
jgi:hypothetical protein